jgi:hypothetical protein
LRRNRLDRIFGIHKARITNDAFRENSGMILKGNENNFEIIDLFINYAGEAYKT